MMMLSLDDVCMMMIMVMMVMLMTLLEPLMIDDFDGPPMETAHDDGSLYGPLMEIAYGDGPLMTLMMCWMMLVEPIMM